MTITIVGRQEFSLPILWQMMKLDLNPALKNYLVADAYKTFFTKTLANFTAQFEQREYRVGQPWAASTSNVQPVPVSAEVATSLKNATEKARIEIDRLTSKLSLRTVSPTPIYVDSSGFSHFAPQTATAQSATNTESTLISKTQLETATASAIDFVKDLVKAINRDVAGSRPEDAGL
jgi:hypothetical protein